MKLAKALSLRLLFGALSLLFISLVSFVANELAPDAAVTLAGEKASLATVQRIRHNMGLDQPWPIRYVRFIANASHGDFGKSYYGVKENVSSILARDLPMTARLALCSMILAASVGILLGTLAAVYRSGFPDRSVLTFSTLGVTLPNFVLGPLLVYIFCVQLDRLPTTWEVQRHAPDYMYMILPVALLAMRPAALLTRLTRESMIDTMQQEFVRMAVAKGVPRGRVIFKHALRNAILPVITAIGTSFGFLLTGSFVVERLFIIPGIGQETIEAIQQGNTPVMQACILVTGAMFVVVNLIVDLLSPILDPRIRESQV